MKKTILGDYPQYYIADIESWAKRLDATDMIIHEDNSITLYQGSDCICDKYVPTIKELLRK